MPGIHSTRRDFLGATAAAAALPWLAPVHAADPTVGANDRINIGLIGCGKMMNGHRGAFTGIDSCRVVAVADVEPKRAKMFKEDIDKRYGSTDCKTYADYRELLARKDIDAVVVATPDHWHALVTIDAFRAGKDVYCEKPLTHTVEEAIKVDAAVKRYGRVLQTGSQQRSDRTFRFAAEMVASGRVGELKEVYCSIGGAGQPCYLGPQTPPDGMNWDMWCGPAPYRDYNEGLAPRDPVKGGWAQWRRYQDYGGGGQCDFGAHAYDIAHWAMGMDESGPVEVIAPQERDDNKLAYRYANGATMIRGSGPIGRGQVTFVGAEGTIGVNRGSYLLTEPETIMLTPTKPSEVHLYDSPDHKRDWLNSVRSRKRSICGAHVGVNTAIACHLGNIAERIGHGFKWDPVKRTTDDVEAQQYLGTIYRGSWAI
jgi:predicted dehydrogenase